MYAISYAIAAVTAGSAFVSFLILRKRKAAILPLVFKIIALVAVAAFIGRFFFQSYSINGVVKLNHGNKFFVALSNLLLWINTLSLIALTITFFYRVPLIDKLISYIVFPFAALNMIFLAANLNAIIDVNGISSFDYRMIFYAVESGLVLALSAFYSFFVGGFKTKLKNIAPVIGIFLLMMLACIPPHALRVWFGNPVYANFVDMNLPHRIMLYINFLLPIGIYFLLKRTPYETRMFGLLFIAFGTLSSFSYSFLFPQFTNLSSWPLHLCNTAMYIIPISIVIRKQQLFYFTYFINVLGALLAILIPNYAEVSSIFSPSLIVFWVNHMAAFFMPLLCVALGIFPKPKMKQYLYSLIGFTVYFVFILFINAWLSNYGSVDFFFTNSNFVAEKLGKWAEDLLGFTASFTFKNLTFTFYPVYQVIFYFVYVAAGFGMWFLYSLGFQLQEPSSGNVRICGFDMVQQSVEAKMNIGYVPDHYALYEKLTGREYLNYIADLYDVSKADRDERLKHYVEIFQLEHAIDNMMKTYSHGMKQKIAIMAALVHNPKIWILDEPLTGLDPNSIYQVKETMKQHAKAGNIVFFSSHIIDVVEKICDRIAIIKGGKLLLVSEMDQFDKSGSKLEDLYLKTIGELPLND